MKTFSKMTVMAICLLLTAIFTSACGGGKSNPPNNSALYYLLAQQNNNQEQNNQQEENNNNQNNQEEENNNEEEPANNTEVTLTLTDSLNADKIASADIFYSVEDNTKSSDDDKEISKATPNADDKTKFVITVNGTATNTKIKAILTYDSEGNLLDYFSSYEGIEATNGTFDIDFENKNGDFAKGAGTDTDPYIISQPRHFANINKQDEDGSYLYLDKNFTQEKDLDFSHLTGLKVVKAEKDKDITIETTNEKAPFFNNGKGMTSIGKMNPEADYFSNIDDEATRNYAKYFFKGNYDGQNHTIDGLTFVNAGEPIIGEGISIDISVFLGIYKGSLKNITIGENSIFFIDNVENPEETFLNIVGISGVVFWSTVENCTNNAKVVVKNIQCYRLFITGIACDAYESNYKNCTNNGNITIDNVESDNIYIEQSIYTDDDSTIIESCNYTGVITVDGEQIEGETYQNQNYEE